MAATSALHGAMDVSMPFYCVRYTGMNLIHSWEHYVTAVGMQ